MLKNKIILISILILIISNILAYHKATQYDFVSRDDYQYVLLNSKIKNLDAQNVKTILTSFHLSNYQPIILFTYAITHSIFELNPHAYHTINIIFHILNSILLLLLLYYITGKSWISFIIAMIFSIHPLQVESVVWISELKGLMCTFFLLLCFISYIRFSRDDKKNFYILSFVLFILALLSKPLAITLPVILLLFEYLEDRLTKKRIIAAAPFFFISGLFFIITVMAQSSRIDIGVHNNFSFVQNIFFSIYSIGFYIIKLILPANLSVDYMYPGSFSYASKEFLISIIVIIAGIAYLINFKKIKRSINFGLLFFIITLLPMLRFVPIGTTFAADRYMYLPMIGLFFALAQIIEHTTLNKMLLQRICLIISAAFILVISSLTYTRCDVWEDKYTYWIDAFESYADPVLSARDLKNVYYVIMPGLGEYYFQKGDYNKARKYYGYALDYDRVKTTVLSHGMTQAKFDEYFPYDKYVEAKKNLLYSIGLSHLQENNTLLAKEYFLQLTKEYPDYSNGHLVLGNLFAAQGNYDEAATYFQKSIQLTPNDSNAHYNFALLLERQGKKEDAIEHYKLAGKYNNSWDLPKKALKRLRTK